MLLYLPTKTLKQIFCFVRCLWWCIVVQETNAMHLLIFSTPPVLYWVAQRRQCCTVSISINGSALSLKFCVHDSFIRRGSMVTHETRIREVPGSNPDADQPDWGFLVIFRNHQGKCRVGFSLPRSIWLLFIKFIYHKIKISELNKWNIDYTTIDIHSLLAHT